VENMLERQGLSLPSILYPKILNTGIINMGKILSLKSILEEKGDRQIMHRPQITGHIRKRGHANNAQCLLEAKRIISWR